MGRRFVLSQEQREEVRRLHSEGKAVSALAARYGVSKSSIGHCLKDQIDEYVGPLHNQDLMLRHWRAA